MAVHEDSRFNFTVLMQVLGADGEPVENTRIDIPYPRPKPLAKSREDARSYRLRPGDHWHAIAARRFRGRSDLWWVIAESTGVIDPFAELHEGIKRGTPVQILEYETVLFEILDFTNVI